MKAVFILVILILSTLTMFSQGKSPVKFDEFEMIPCDDYLSRMDNAINHAANNPNAQVYVIVYEGKVGEYVYDHRGKPSVKFRLPEVGLAKAKIRSMKKYLDVRGTSKRQFVFVSGGYQENFAVELWLVPKDAEKPVTKPNKIRMKYRRGKPAGFCIDCC
jgi:hypothetical protein